MKSTILDIFHGVKGQMEGVEKPNGFYKNRNELLKINDELKANLSPELFNMFDKYIDLTISDYTDSIDFFFSEGFKLGLMLVIECITA